MKTMASITDKTDALRELATHVRRERENANLTQLEVATKAGVSQPLYAGVELGMRPMPVHRAPDFGDSVVLGSIRYLLSKLVHARYELVNASEERLCASSMATLAVLVRKSSAVCAVMAAALEDGRLTDQELDDADNELAELEETVRRVRRDVAVRRELSKRQQRELAGLVKTRTGSGLQCKTKVG
jgi:DNA-binding XRE family transcriptional regulator